MEDFIEWYDASCTATGSNKVMGFFSVIVVSSVFVGLFCIDMSGDRVGYVNSLWIAFVLAGILPLHYVYLNDGARRFIQRGYRYTDRYTDSFVPRLYLLSKFYLLVVT